MKTSQWLKRSLFGLLCSAAVLQAAAQSFPSKAVNLVVPYPAGGPSDFVARQLQPELNRLLGQPVMRYIRMTEHVGRPNVSDPLQNTRSTAVAAPWRWLAWYMNFHAEHHIAPSMPFHALPGLQQLLGERLPQRRGYRQGHREILRQLFGRS